MTTRPDKELLGMMNRYVSPRRENLRYLPSEIAKHPVIHITPSLTGSLFNTTSLLEHEDFSISRIPFEKFSIYSDRNGLHQSLWIEVKQMIDTGENYLDIQSITVPNGAQRCVLLAPPFIVGLGEDAQKAVWENAGFIFDKHGATELQEDSWEDGIENLIIKTGCHIIGLFKFIEENSYYPIQRESTKRVKGLASKKFWKNPTGPHVIYMNRLPGTGSHESTGTGKPLVKGHQRRAVSRTLRHPKFINNPKYGVPGAIKVKPTWVGPTETTHEGNIYRLLSRECEV